ncbi:regulator of cell morphogenesis and NO signaling [Caulobacter ginsengisoli]|uniref:Regulator of cell morphogenesis and NO signaling n=1 Tax=Caulobacter ginsengisoli TaxID=400775 RepID=A0ABU0IR23_9CAUL|nr:hemerythrin domain-containing protein [Caulobacter ginsengisoli]MDQ0464419.1 regulator of cell morphogenesis and NO signaling [Caulobacter ginsengisoli]
MLEDPPISSANHSAATPQIRCALMTPKPDGDPDLRSASLIGLILTQYHEPHRRELPQAIALARKVEAMHAAEPECPRGLADLLTFMLDDLESHQQREEQVLFPMILAGGSPMIRFPVQRMMAEHEDVEAQLLQLRTLTQDFSHPPGACATWRALTALCRKLDVDLREHMQIENQVLFAPFLD